MSYDVWIAEYNKLCGCKNVLPAYFDSAWGRDTYLQCQDCGVSRIQPFDVLPPNAVPYNIKAHQAFEKKRSDSWVRELVRRDSESSKRKKGYTAYLGTPEWQATREKILKRDKYICQGCLTAAATEVHHTTYAHVRNELAFELVSLCHACHKKVHE